MSIANTEQAEYWNTGPGVAHWISNQVHQLEPARFDVVLSRFGVMFFADPVAAFANIRSATRSGGRLVFACWQPLAANQWLLVPGAALAEHVPPPGGFGAGDGPGMFAFADPDRLRPILAAAGWRDVEITSEHASILVGGGGSVDDAVEFLRTATMGRTMLAGADAATADRALASVRAALTPYADDDGVHLGAAVWLVQAAALYAVVFAGAPVVLVRTGGAPYPTGPCARSRRTRSTSTPSAPCPAGTRRT